MRNEFFELDAALAVEDRPLELAVIIPTFNESANVEPMLQRLALVLAGIHWEAVFVDDHSPDGTAEKVREIARTNPSVRIVERVGRRGLSSAVIEGMLATAAPVLAVIDGDGQHDERLLPRLFEAVHSGNADIAIGTRYAEGGSTGDWDKGRLRISQGATHLAQRLLRLNVSDPMSGFFALSRETLNQALPRLSNLGFKILADVIASLPAPPRVAELPYVFGLRLAGESKADARVAADYLALILDKTVGRVVPLRFLSFMAVGLFGAGVHMGTLWLSMQSQLTFFWAEIVAVMTAMTSNFILNNSFTYRDRRLKGWRMLGGLFSFYAVCSVGAVANVGVGTLINQSDGRWWLAGLAGVMISAVWNYAGSATLTWRQKG